MVQAPTFQDVEAAAVRGASVVHRTPVLRSRLLNEQLGADVVFKCENFQRVGAFKFRGAYNALAQFTPEQRRAGVVAYSSGNHAQAVALSAQLLGIPATIVMPHDGPASKIAATKAYGGQVVPYDRYTEDVVELTRAFAEERGLTFVPPFDHPHVIAGQGTVARELFAEVGELDALFVPLGGGGLLSGTALVAREVAPGCRLYGVEPAAGDDGRQSLRQGSLVRIETPKTIADGAQTQHLGDYTFEIIRHGVTDILTVTDDELVDAMRAFATYMKLVVEPTGCLGLAAVRGAADQLRGQRVGVVISGGNIDLDRYAALLAAG